MTVETRDPGRRVLIAAGAFAELFLAASDFDAGMRQVQDDRARGPRPSDRAFPRFRGVRAGFNIWVGPTDRPAWRVVDVRWAFPTEPDAAAYLRAGLAANAEGAPPVPDAPLVGAECHVFGGPAFGGPLAAQGLRVLAYLYVFRAGRVVAKLFVAQGPAVAGQVLTADHAAALVRRALARIEGRAG
jgi:hypothetical protein